MVLRIFSVTESMKNTFTQLRNYIHLVESSYPNTLLLVVQKIEVGKAGKCVSHGSRSEIKRLYSPHQ